MQILTQELHVLIAKGKRNCIKWFRERECVNAVVIFDDIRSDPIDMHSGNSSSDNNNNNSSNATIIRRHKMKRVM